MIFWNSLPGKKNPNKVVYCKKGLYLPYMGNTIFVSIITFIVTISGGFCMALLRENKELKTGQLANKLDINTLTKQIEGLDKQTGLKISALEKSNSDSINYLDRLLTSKIDEVGRNLTGLTEVISTLRSDMSARDERFLSYMSREH